MKKLFIFSLWLFAQPNPTHAQKHDYVWYNGYITNYIIDFISGNPEIHLTGSDYNFLKTMTTMSDAEGRMAFYSHGCNIRNAEHEIIENSEDLLPNDYFCSDPDWEFMNFAHSAGVTLPLFDNGQYIMICRSYDLPLGAQPCSANRLFAHYIDMTANNGQGKVTLKNQEIAQGCFQEPSANRHSNGRDWWILTPDNEQDRFYRWLLTPQGLQGPWVQEMENPIIDNYWYCGWSEFSPNGEHYLINGCRTGFVVYDFDRCTGLLSRPRTVIRTEFSTSNEPATFSPNSRLVYTVDRSDRDLLQFDLDADTLLHSWMLLGTWQGTVDSFSVPDVFGHIQHGPDGKLYEWGGGSTYMHVIDFPNRRGAACQLRTRAIKLPSVGGGPSLYYPNFRLGPIDGSSCDTLGIDNLPVANFRHEAEDTLVPLAITFTDLSYYEPATWSWHFGDPASGAANMSQDTSPVHLFSAPGMYEVCLTVCNDNACDTLCKTVSVGVSGLDMPLITAAGVQLWPNPTRDVLHFQAENVIEWIELYDAQGRMVLRRELADIQADIAVHKLPAGLYLAVARTGAGVWAGRFVVER